MTSSVCGNTAVFHNPDYGQIRDLTIVGSLHIVLTQLMARVEINKQAPDFELSDFTGKNIKLSSFAGEKNVLVVFNRGLG